MPLVVRRPVVLPGCVPRSVVALLSLSLRGSTAVAGSTIHIEHLDDVVRRIGDIDLLVLRVQEERHPDAPSSTVRLNSEMPPLNVRVFASIRNNFSARLTRSFQDQMLAVDGEAGR